MAKAICGGGLCVVPRHATRDTALVDVAATRSFGLSQVEVASGPGNELMSGAGLVMARTVEALTAGSEGCGAELPLPLHAIQTKADA